MTLFNTALISHFHVFISQSLTDGEGESTSASLLDLIRTPKMRKHTFILMFNWWDLPEITRFLPTYRRCWTFLFVVHRFTSAVVYQGLVMRLGIAGGNVYIDFLISALVEFPAAFLILFTIERIGRRLPFATANIVAGASCFIAAFIPDSEFYA